jgi:transcriptional regulator with AAA-type ATPase domain
MFGGNHDMVRSELFGHIKGAFTGAFHDKDGWIRKADGGLLVLYQFAFKKRRFL